MEADPTAEAGVFWPRHLALVRAAVPRPHVLHHQHKLCPGGRDNGPVARVQVDGHIVQANQLRKGQKVTNPQNLGTEGRRCFRIPFNCTDSKVKNEEGRSLCSDEHFQNFLSQEEMQMMNPRIV